MTTEVRFFGGRYSVEYPGALEISAKEGKVYFEGECRAKYLGPDITLGLVPYWHGLYPFVVLDLRPRPWEVKRPSTGGAQK
jgi:hypothetical protein